MLHLVHSPKNTLKYISIGARSDQEQAEVQAPHLAWKTLLMPPPILQRRPHANLENHSSSLPFALPFSASPLSLGIQSYKGPCSEFGIHHDVVGFKGLLYLELDHLECVGELLVGDLAVLVRIQGGHH